MYGRHFVGRNHKNFYAREGKLGPIVFSHMIDSDVSCDPLIRMILRYDFYPFLIILALSAHFIFPLLSFTPLLSSFPHLLVLISLTSPFPSSFSYPYSFLYSSSLYSQSYLPHSHHTSHTHTHSYTPPHHIHSLTSPIPLLYLSVLSVFHPSIISSFTQDRKWNSI